MACLGKSIMDLDAFRGEAVENRLRHLREAQGMSLRRLAAEVSAGPGEPVDWTAVRMWERGRIPRRHRSQLADVFGVSVAHLLGTDGLEAVA
jgi:transcriptional regulator with XRE-family HTH domain